MTILNGGDVVCRRRFTGGKVAVMAAFATASNALVIKDRRRKGRAGDMAGAAIILGWNMGFGLAGGNGAVMARGAVVYDSCMVEGRANKGIRCEVTKRAVFRSRQVVLG